MVERIAAFLLAAVCCAVVATDAQAMKCGSIGEVHTALEEAFGEQRVWAGSAGQGQVMELFVNEDRPSWTIVLRTPNGMACPTGSGGRWREFETAPKQENDDA